MTVATNRLQQVDPARARTYPLGAEAFLHLYRDLDGIRYLLGEVVAEVVPRVQFGGEPSDLASGFEWEYKFEGEIAARS